MESLFKSILKLFFSFILLLLSPGVLGQQSQQLQKLTVILDWFINPDHAPLFVAQQQGYYKQQGLDVTFVAPADPADPAVIARVRIGCRRNAMCRLGPVGFITRRKTAR